MKLNLFSVHSQAIQLFRNEFAKQHEWKEFTLKMRTEMGLHYWIVSEIASQGDFLIVFPTEYDKIYGL